MSLLICLAYLRRIIFYTLKKSIGNIFFFFSHVSCIHSSALDTYLLSFSLTHVSTRPLWIHISSLFPHSCIHSAALDTYLYSFSFTHVSTRLLWIHISSLLPSLMYPLGCSGYISSLFFLHSCIHAPTLDTYLHSSPLTHVSTRPLWIHIFTLFPSLMSPLDPSGYISSLFFLHSCIHAPALDTHLRSFPSLMSPLDPSGYISPLFFPYSCIHSTSLDTYLHSFSFTHVSTHPLWIHIFALFPSLMYPLDPSGYISSLFFLHSCIYAHALDTYFLSFSFTHVSTHPLWIHIFTLSP